MSEALLERPRALPRLLPLVAVSLLLHGALLAYLEARPRALDLGPKPVELTMVEVEVEPPPPPPPKEEPPPPPIKVASTRKPPPPPEAEPAPPPPNEAPPPEAPKEPVPLVVGISMSSTTTAGTFTAPVGNTLYGKTDDTAQAPADVKAYAAPKYVPIYQVDAEPRMATEVKIPYPPEAKRAGVEGSVTLSLTIDAEGKVVKARVLSGPGYGLNEAAQKAMLRFRFHPATKDGQPVSTEWKYTYTFLLD